MMGHDNIQELCNQVELFNHEEKIVLNNLKEQVEGANLHEYLTGIFESIIGSDAEDRVKLDFRKLGNLTVEEPEVQAFSDLAPIT